MPNSGNSLADVLERVLDKGVVIVGDIAVNVVDVELLTLRLRLFIASAQTAREMGMDWWSTDRYFTPNAPAAVDSEPAPPTTLDASLTPRSALAPPARSAPGAAPAPDPRDELAALRARIAELEAALPQPAPARHD